MPESIGAAVKLRGGAGEALGHALPIHFLSESWMKGMAWIIGAVAVTAWGATTTTGPRNRAKAKIA